MVLLSKVDETTPNPFSACGHMVCYLGEKGKQGLETSEGSLAAGESVAVSESR